MANANPFVWYELMTSDLDAAEKFYGEVVGWKMRDPGMPGQRYTLAHAGDARAAGLMTIPEEAREAGGRPGWIGYIGVDDVDAYASASRTKAARFIASPPTFPVSGALRSSVIRKA